MRVLIESHYVRHYQTVALRGCRCRSAVWTEPRTMSRVQNLCLLCLQHVQTSVRRYTSADRPRPTHRPRCCIRQYLRKNTASANASNEMMQASGERASVFILFNILHTIETVFIKEMTDHNISLIGLNRNATTILQITP